MSEPQPGAEGPLYYSERGLGQWQVEGIAQWLVMQSLLCCWDTGCGKTHLVLAGGALMHEDEKIDLLVVVCEKNKVKEWMADFAKFTRLRVVKYVGNPKQREKIRASIESGEGPQVIVTTYGVSRQDLGSFSRQKVNGRTKKVWVEGPLVETLRIVARRRGLAIAYDESSKLANRWAAGFYKKNGRNPGWVSERGSVLYKAHDYALAELRKVTDQIWVTGMTATKVETSPENFFNQFRLVDPVRAGSVAAYEKDYVRYRDPFGNPSFKNLSEDDIHREPWVTPLIDKIRPILSYKSKNDADVVALFPEMVEEPRFVTLTDEHQALYNAVCDLEYDEDVFPDGFTEADSKVLFGIKRMVASHPLVLAHSTAAATEGTLANLIVQRVGYEALAAIKVAKVEELVEDMKLLVHGQGAQALVFTFFGPTLIPILRDRLAEEGFSTASYYGGISGPQREKAIDAFKAGDAQILLCSDSAARGLNLPEASYVWNYELCLTHGKVVQRVNRASRLGQGGASVTVLSMIALETIEEKIFDSNIQRQEWEEHLTPDGSEAGADLDEGVFFTMLGSEERKALFEGEKKKARRRKAVA